VATSHTVVTVRERGVCVLPVRTLFTEVVSDECIHAVAAVSLTLVVRVCGLCSGAFRPSSIPS